MKVLFKAIIVILSFLLTENHVFAQKKDSTLTINGELSITNNGFSFIPAFTLDKPAGISIITVSKNKLSFQSQIRYSLEGRPWAIAFVSRYKVINTPKASVTAGVYFPGIAFFESKVVQNGIEKILLQSQQSVAPELNASFPVSKHFMLGATYLYNRSMGGVPPLNGHYGGIWASLFDLKISKTLRLAIDSQLFYLNLDGADGTYTSFNFTLSKTNFPITLSSMMFKTIKSNIGGKDANWNLSLNYRFGSKYKMLNK